jgi:hypothetical protein
MADQKDELDWLLSKTVKSGKSLYSILLHYVDGRLTLNKINKLTRLWRYGFYCVGLCVVI